MHRPYRIGCGVRSDDTTAFHALAGLYDRGRIDHIQVQIIPEPGGIFQERIDEIGAAGVPIVIHAPHHGEGVNPADPTLCEGFDPRTAPRHVEDAMNLTLCAADLLGSDCIVIHAGRYRDGNRKAAFENVRGFLREYADPRMALENLPSVYAGYALLGDTADELAAIAGDRVRGFCLDFAHLYCTANFRNLSYTDELNRFERLAVRHQHLSNNLHGSVTDQHLELDHPAGGLDFPAVFDRIARNPEIATTLEYKRDTYEVYLRQLEVFDELYHRYAGIGERMRL